MCRADLTPSLCFASLCNSEVFMSMHGQTCLNVVVIPVQGNGHQLEQESTSGFGCVLSDLLCHPPRHASAAE